jgi:hypothetical protein
MFSIMLKVILLPFVLSGCLSLGYLLTGQKIGDKQADRKKAFKLAGIFCLIALVALIFA